MEERKYKIKFIIIVLVLTVISALLGASYALLLWNSENNTELTIKIGDVAGIYFKTGNNINVSNLGPVFDYEKDGESTYFTISNYSNEEITLDANFNITSITSNLKEESFKYVVMSSNDNINYKVVKEDNFVNINNNDVIPLFQELKLLPNSTISYKLIIYIDGNMLNPTTMQNGSLSGIINVSENATLVTDELLKENVTITTGNIDLKYTTYGSREITLKPGTYKLEVWGAQGGSYDSTYIGGKGGYSYGTLTLAEETTAFVYVGQQNNSYSTSTGMSSNSFNGGGSGYSSVSGSFILSYGLPGGGATDIRLNTDSLYSRIIVAGGGSGSLYLNSFGNETGHNGYYGGGSSSGASDDTYKATQTSAGKNGAFGVGASISSSSLPTVGGGGGWYGGGSYGASTSTYAGGGSGYVYTSSTATNYPSGCLLNSSYYLTDAATIAGNQSFANINGETVTGNSGHGAARISGVVEKEVYTIPTLVGLTDIFISKGNNIDLEAGVELQCGHNDTNCSLSKISITDTSQLDVGTYIVYYTVVAGNGKNYKYTRTLNVNNNLDMSGANVPILTNNLVPVMHNGTTWVIADPYNANSAYKWYDYDNRIWANAVLLSEAKRNGLTKDSNGNYTPGQTIGDSESAGVLAFYVWIPRYKYKVWNKDKLLNTDSYSAGTKGIDIIFEKGTETTGTITCTYSYTYPTSENSKPNENCTGKNGDYYTHPAFKFGTDELTGIWIGKFYLSSSTPTAASGGGNSITLTPRTLPNVNSWRGNPITNFWKVIYDMQNSSNIYGLSTDRTKVDSHMITSMEWGAMTYLTHSKYGRCNGASCTETASNVYYTGTSNNKNFKTGCGPQSETNFDSGSICNEYTSTLGFMSSTVGNIYGIYDISGAVGNWVMGNFSSTDNKYEYYASNGGTNYTYAGYEKYLTPYSYVDDEDTTLAYKCGRLGDATSEITIQRGVGWNDDETYYDWGAAWYIRGYSADGDYLKTGIFSYDTGIGADGSYYSTRAVLSIFTK